MLEVGRVCVKLSGRDAGKHCIIIDTIDDNYVIIDGLTRRRKCNVKHLEPLETLVKIKKNAAHAAILEELKELGIKIPKEKKKFGKGEKGPKQRPKKKRKVKEKKAKAKEEKEKAKAKEEKEKAKAKAEEDKKKKEKEKRKEKGKKEKEKKEEEKKKREEKSRKEDNKKDKKE